MFKDNESMKLGLITLFASSSTLICCALPALFVLLGAGATFASLVNFFPQLIIISQYKISISNRLEQQLNTYSIKLFEYTSNNNNNKNYNHMNIILKISGVWANAYEMGITFKFYTH